jgi:hypothetical protein
LLTELTDGPSGCGEVARGGCLYAGNFIMTRSTVLTVADKRRYTKHDAVAALLTRS